LATVDGILLPDHPQHLFSTGRFNKPSAAMLGSVLDEWNFVVATEDDNFSTREP
jgi:hypothetical protein